MPGIRTSISTTSGHTARAAATASAPSPACATTWNHATAHDWPKWTPGERASYDPVRAGYAGPFDLAVLALGTLGVLAASGEYGTGLIRTTFTATPRRSQVVTAKILVVGGFTLVLAETIAFVVFEIGRHLIASTGAPVGLSDPHVARAVAGSGWFVAASALTGLRLGAISDTTAKASLPSVFQSIAGIKPPPADRVLPSVPAAFAILAGYVVLSLGAAFVAVRRRDA